MPKAYIVASIDLRVVWKNFGNLRALPAMRPEDRAAGARNEALHGSRFDLNWSLRCALTM